MEKRHYSIAGYICNEGIRIDSVNEYGSLEHQQREKKEDLDMPGTKLLQK